jgi:pimeloyl-ACP methyl ester carboxylesterase
MSGYLEPIIGRYVHVEIDGETHRIYFEENGAGIPLVCLHTAGSDGRQWRHLLIDEAFAKNFRIIAFDMPWHGKSNPPASWGGEEYQLTTARYTATIRAFCKTLELDRPVVMGCSIGGRIVLNLAIDHAAEFRALIGLEAADFQAPWYDTNWLNRPDVHGGEVCAALVSGLIAPQSPETARMETLWAYKQGGPASSRATCIFTASMATCAAGSRGSILKYAHSICSRASMISPVRRKIPNGPLPRSEGPASRSWSSLVIFQ